MDKNNSSGLPVVPLHYSVPLLIVCVLVLGILVFIFNLSAPGVFFNPPVGAVNVSACGTLGVNNTYYYLNTSLTFTTSDCLIIIGNNTVLDGENRYNLTGNNNPGTSAVLVLGNNVTVRGLNISFAYNGIKVQNANNAYIAYNLINYSNYSINVSISSGTRVFQNALYYPSFAGIYFESVVSGYIQQNFVYGREAVGGSSVAGIGLIASSSNNVSENYVLNTIGALGMYLSNENTFSKNIIDRPIGNGIFVWVSLGTRNIIQHNRIINSSASAIYLDNVNDILLLNNTAFNTNASYYDLEAGSVPSNLEISDNYVARYIFNNSFLKFRNAGNSRINFTQPATISGANLNSDVRLGFDFVDVNSNLRPGLNKSALVTFEGLSTNFVNATIFRNGVSCPSNICTALTDLNAGTVIFNVSSWTNYTVGSGVPPGPTMSIDEPDNNDIYYPSSFPVLFDVDLSQNGTAWFNLNGGANATMNTTNNRSFTYSQGVLSYGNYTFNAYATFTGNSQTASASVIFRVLNTSIFVLPVNNTNNTQNNTPPLPPPNTTIHLNTTNSSNLPGSGGSVEFKYVAYWLVVAVLAIAIVVLILLIVKYFSSRKIEMNTIPGSIVSQLR